MSVRIMIIAGEASGDTHGASLIRALQKRSPGLETFGIGGDKMKEAGMQLVYHVDQLSYVGFTEIVRHLFFFRKVFRELIALLQQRKPDVVVLIDFPGFNLRFARKAKSLGFNVFYFVAPQVWAWAKWRAKKMAKYIDRLAVLFDFEVPFFERYGLKTFFVGHPLVDKLVVNDSKERFCEQNSLNPSLPILALLPGSRAQEVAKLLPVMLQTAQLIKQKHADLQVIISQAPTIDRSLIAHLARPYPWAKIMDHSTYAMVKYADAAIVASGTATLETAFLQTPFVIVYRVSKITYQIGKRMIKLPYIGLANVVAGQRIVAEFIQHDAVADRIAPQVERLIFDPEAHARMHDRLAIIREKLGASGAADRTARLLLELLER